MLVILLLVIIEYCAVITIDYYHVPQLNDDDNRIIMNMAGTDMADGT